MSATHEIHSVEVGDLVHTTGRHVGDPGRTGEIVAVLGADDHPHYLVRWDDDRETILYPREGTTIRRHGSDVSWAD